jgi:hypothetical protein
MMRAKLIPQIEMLPRPLLPDIRANAPTADEVFAQPKPTPERNPGRQLVECSPSPERDLLISQYFTIIETIDKFLAKEIAMKRSQLEQKLATAAEACRAAKDLLATRQVEIASINSQLSAHQSGQLQNAKEFAASVDSQRPRESDFPTAEETQLWLLRHAEAKAHLEGAVAIHHELARASELARIVHVTAADAYNKRVSEYEAAKRELAQMNLT